MRTDDRADRALRACRRAAAAGRLLPAAARRRPACSATHSGGGSPRSLSVVAIKIAPFNRYQTLDVVRALADSGPRRHRALHRQRRQHRRRPDHAVSLRAPETGSVERRIVGGLLGHWAVWTQRAVRLLAECHAAVASGQVPVALLRTGSGSDRRERRVLRRRERLRRLHRRDQRSASAAGAADERALSRSARNAQSASGGSDRSRLPRVSPPERRRFRRRPPRRVAALLSRPHRNCPKSLPEWTRSNQGTLGRAGAVN